MAIEDIAVGLDRARAVFVDEQIVKAVGGVFSQAAWLLRDINASSVLAAQLGDASHDIVPLLAFDLLADTLPRAGPSFTFDRRLTMLPHRNAAWQNLRMQLDRMRHIAAELAQSTAFPQPIGERLQLIYENVSRIQMNFDNAMLLRGDHDER